MTIPTILAGPIVRRVEKNYAYIWLATSETVKISAKLYKVIPRKDEERKRKYRYKKITDFTSQTSYQLGENLYIQLIKIEPEKEVFPSNTLLAYNLILHTTSGKKDLEDLRLLDKNHPESIVYGDLDYPTFYIREHQDQKLLYGSCRKPHGEGWDLFIGADLRMQEHYKNLEERPSHLFLLGDQIYADDVADPLFPVISKLSKEIMGSYVEDLSHIEKRLETKSFQQALGKVHGRQFVSENFCRFTSNNAYNHLFTFGEYAAMYLLTWNPSLWEYMEMPSFEQLQEHDGLYFVFNDSRENEEDRIKELEQHKLRYHEQLKQINQFKKGIHATRRLMANTPTYMIFDDHDITDDWNISANWQKNVWEEPLGRHVIANGITAYWAFQGLGNDPSSFHRDFSNAIFDYFASLTNGFQHTEDVLYKEWIHHVWNFDSWFYLAPIHPTALVLDTRTMRHFEPTPKPTKIGRTIDETIKSPELIRAEGWRNISSKLLASDWKKGENLIIISPVPLYGIELIESVLQQYVVPLRLLGLPVHYQFDMEAWKFNGRGFHAFIERLVEWGASNYFILSGDTHLASAVRSKVEYESHHPFTIHQFTSSPIHNMSFSGLFGRLLKSAIWFNSLKRKRKVINRSCDLDFQLVEGIHELDRERGSRWKETIKYLVTNRGSVVESENNIGILSIDNESVQNTLLTYNGKAIKETHYEKASLKSST